MEVTAYQTLEDKGNIEDVELEGPYICLRADAWLGHGYYLWDTEIKWAKQWGRRSYRMRGKRFIIGQCGVRIDSACFDLVGNIAHRKIMRECIHAMRGRKLFKHEELTVANIIHFMKNNNLFEYKSIRAQDSPNDGYQIPFRVEAFEDGTINVKEVMDINQRVQICVIEKKNVILQPFKVIYP